MNAKRKCGIYTAHSGTFNDMKIIHNINCLLGNKVQNYVICRKMDRTRDHHVKQNKPDLERQILNVFSHMWNQL
jgi:hypothetical protein